MFNFTFPRKSEPTKLAKVLDDLFDDLDSHESSSEEYANTADQVVKLAKLQQETQSSWRPSPDAVLSVAGTLLVTLVVLHKEKADVITSKAFGFIGKMK